MAAGPYVVKQLAFLPSELGGADPDSGTPLQGAAVLCLYFTSPWIVQQLSLIHISEPTRRS
eukprot:4946501-Prymnesium_polylepis.1